MKQIIILFLLFSFTSVSFSQQTEPVSKKANVNYLKKSKTQKTFAWILTGVGVAVVTVGALTQGYVDAFTGLTYEKNAASPIVYAIGGSCITGGIVLFVASSKNRKRAVAASVYINRENSPMFRASAANNKTYPVLGLRLSLK